MKLNEPKFAQPQPADDEAFERAWKKAEPALRYEAHDTDLPEANDLPDVPEGHLVMGVRRRGRP